VPAVRFAIGTRPELSERDAGVLADHLARGNMVAIRLAAKIRTHVAALPLPSVSGDIDLDHDELKEIAGLLARNPELLGRGYDRLRDEVLAALVRPAP